MLYIWPLFAFFSAPLIVPSVLSRITRPIQYLKSLLSVTSQRAALISIPYTLLTGLLSVAIVKYNTIIHPFTLADNRHYMFYVFRYTILRSPTTRLSLVAAYTACRWLVWDQLTALSDDATQPPPTQAQPQQQQQQQQQQQPPPQQQQPTTKPTPQPYDDGTPHHPPLTSTTLLWLLTTALSLVTAPLVEPRYFILPWVFYRLLVPRAAPPSRAAHGADSKNTPNDRGLVPRAADWLAGDGRLVLEAGWFVVVNGVTMWVFLFWGFYWRGEDGAVGDGGRVQRFMW